jgi:hypothetical protein
MLSRLYLRRRIRATIEDAGGFLSDHAIDQIDDLVDTVVEHTEPTRNEEDC